MKKFTVTLSDKLFNKLESIRQNTSIKEKNEITFNDVIEEAIMGYFNIKLNDINENKEIIDATIIDTIVDVNNLNDYYVYVYYNDRNRIVKNVGDYYFYSEPIYIGKGHGDRMYEINNRNQNLVEFINELKSTNSFTIVKLVTNLTETDAYHYEELFINAFGRLCDGTGSLYNIKSGNMKKNHVNSSGITNLNLEYQLIDLILKSLNETNNVSKTAKSLNINLRTLYRKLKKYSIMKKNNVWVVDNL